MRFSIYALSAVMVLGLSACSSSSSGGGSGALDAEDSAAAAALMATDMSETADVGMEAAVAPEGNRMSAARMEAAQAASCTSGSSQSGTENGVDVGSPYTESMDNLEWEYYEDCVIEDGGGVTNDGYRATAEMNAGGYDHTYEKWTNTLSHGYDAGDFTGEGFLIENSLFGDWDLTMVSYSREDMGDIYSEVYMDWIITVPDWESGGILGTSHITLGEGPGDGERLAFREWPFTAGDVFRTIEGYASMTMTGEQSCSFAVHYETENTLDIKDAGTEDEYVDSGVLHITVEGVEGVQVVEWSGGDMFVNEQPYNPEDVPEDCKLEQEAEF